MQHEATDNWRTVVPSMSWGSPSLLYQRNQRRYRYIINYARSHRRQIWTVLGRNNPEERRAFYLL